MLLFYAISSVKLIHVLSIACWFGPKLLVPADLRRAIHDGGAAMEQAIARINLVQKVTIAASMVTLASGLGMIFLYGGFKHVPLRIHIGLGLTLAIFGLGAFGVDKAWARLRDGIRGGRAQAELAQLERKMAFLMTCENVVWIAVLLLMVFKLEVLSS
jgi:hypothetical protein